MDELGRFKFSDEERGRLRALWRSPADQELFNEMKRQWDNILMQRLRSCPPEEVAIVRGQLDAMDLFFKTIGDTVGEEVEQDDGSADERGKLKTAYVSQAI